MGQGCTQPRAGEFKLGRILPQGKMDALGAAGVEVGLNLTEAGEPMAEIVGAL